jgi:hypothetical protein
MYTQALLAASGRVREMQDKEHLAGFGIEVGEVKYDRQKVADHAANLVSTVAKNLGGSLTALGVDQVIYIYIYICVYMYIYIHIYMCIPVSELGAYVSEPCVNVSIYLASYTALSLSISLYPKPDARPHIDPR